MRKTNTILLAAIILAFATTTTAQVINPALVPAPQSIWQPLPQFQPKEATTYRWYALENAQDKDYWDNVDITRLIICLNKGLDTQAVSGLVKKYGLLSTGKRSMFPDILNYYIYTVTNSSREKVLQIITEAKQNSAISCAEPEGIITEQTCYSNDPYNYPNAGWEQWGNHALWIDSAWCIVYKGGWGQWVGVIDNALDYTHPDIGVVYENDFADGDVDVKPDWTGRQTHGTHVTGIIGGKTNNGIGIAGVCNDTVFFIKAVKDGDTLFDTEAARLAILEMARFPKLRVINMSWGMLKANSMLEAACNYAWSQNKLLIAASGNNAKEQALYPANYDNVIAVGSVGYDISTTSVVFSPFSNYSSKQEITAAGGNGDGGPYDIWSTLPSGKYGRMAGTSMAAPMVAGVAALMFDVNPSLSNADARNLLQHNVFDAGPVGWDKYYGFGIVCGWCAVNAAKEFKTPVTPHAAIQSVNTNNFGMKVYPNPSKGNINVELTGNGADTKLLIFNAIGEKVWSDNVGVSQTITADLSKYPSGFYFAIAKFDGKEEIGRFSIIK